MWYPCVPVPVLNNQLFTSTKKTHHTSFCGIAFVAILPSLLLLPMLTDGILRPPPSPPKPPFPPLGIVYIGCYNDSIILQTAITRALPNDYSPSNRDMSIEICADSARKNGFQYFATQYGYSKYNVHLKLLSNSNICNSYLAES